MSFCPIATGLIDTHHQLKKDTSMFLRSLLFPLMTCLALAFVMTLSSCSDEQSKILYSRDLVADFPLPEELQEAVDKAWRSIGEPYESTVWEDHLRTFCHLQTLQNNPSTADSALALFTDIIKENPENPIWLELARYKFGAVPKKLPKTLYTIPTLADSSSALGRFALAVNSKKSDRIRHLEDALEKSSQWDPFATVWCRHLLIRTRDRRTNPQSALEQWLALLKDASVTKSPRLQMMIWYEISYVLGKTQRPSEAAQAAILAANLAATHKAEYRLGLAQRRAAYYLTNAKEPEIALSILQDGMKHTEQFGFTRLQADMEDRATFLYIGCGEFGRALTLYHKGLRQALADRDSSEVIRARVNIGRTHWKMGETDSSQHYMEKALLWRSYLSNPRDKIKLAVHTYSLFMHVGDFARADTIIAQAEALVSANTNANTEASVLLARIRLGRQTGRPAEVYRAIDRLRQIQRALTYSKADYSIVADAETVIAEFLGWQGEHASAREALDAARIATKNHGVEMDRWWLERCAFDLAMWSEDPVAAHRAAKACLEVADNLQDQDMITVSRCLMGRYYLTQKNYTAAHDMFKIPETVFDDQEYRTVLSCFIYRGIASSKEGDYTAALGFFEQANKFSTTTAPPDLQARMLLESGRIALVAQDIPQAQTQLEAAFDLLNKTRAHNQIEALQVFYTELYEDVIEALINLYLEHPDQVAGDNTAQRTLVLAEASRWQAHFNPGHQHDRADRIRTPNPGSPIIAFFVGQNRSYRWLITDQSIQIQKLPGRNDLKSQLAPVLADLSSPSSEVNQGAIGTLSQTLLAGLAPNWDAEKTLYILPHDLLSSVPWYALSLVQPNQPTQNILTHGPCVEITSIHPPAGTETANKRIQILAIGANTTNDHPGKRLRHAELEAQEIVELFEPGDAELLTGQNADWSNLRSVNLMDYRAIHLATHTTLYQGQTGQSVIRFDSSDDAIPLSMNEVGTLKLDADLVFLSCCEASRRISDSGATANFAHAFLRAGAKSVVAPGLRIDDQAARLLATRFYGHWLNNTPPEMSLRYALQEIAQTSDRTRHPHYWASYRLIVE